MRSTVVFNVPLHPPAHAPRYGPPGDGNWVAISIDSNPLLRRPSKLIASRFPTPKKHHAMSCAEMAGVPSGIQRLQETPGLAPDQARVRNGQQQCGIRNAE